MMEPRDFEARVCFYVRVDWEDGRMIHLLRHDTRLPGVAYVGGIILGFRLPVWESFYDPEEERVLVTLNNDVTRAVVSGSPEEMEEDTVLTPEEYRNLLNGHPLVMCVDLNPESFYFPDDEDDGFDSPPCPSPDSDPTLGAVNRVRSILDLITTGGPNADG